MFGKIKLTDFSLRHFDKKFGGTKIMDIDPEEFEKTVNEKCLGLGESSTMTKLMDGYAPFCKLIAIPNFTKARIGTMKIDMANYQYLRSGYSSRTPKELPVFSRWFELPLAAPVADWLIVVVYDKAQIDKEGRETEGEGVNPEEKYVPLDADWGIVAILAQSHPNEEPMAPATMLRNALGVSEGGSGVPINREAYTKSVEFWSEHAIVKS
jgi:hypothetical protein